VSSVSWFRTKKFDEEFYAVNGGFENNVNFVHSNILGAHHGDIQDDDEDVYVDEIPHHLPNFCLPELSRRFQNLPGFEDVETSQNEFLDGKCRGLDILPDVVGR
jgi:hypothetical protein